MHNGMLQNPRDVAHSQGVGEGVVGEAWRGLFGGLGRLGRRVLAAEAPGEQAGRSLAPGALAQLVEPVNGFVVSLQEIFRLGGVMS